jgi:hypothetical protein
MHVIPYVHDSLVCKSFWFEELQAVAVHSFSYPSLANHEKRIIAVPRKFSERDCAQPMA